MSSDRASDQAKPTLKPCPDCYMLPGQVCVSMSKKTIISIGDIAACTHQLDVACSRCNCRGCYSTKRLLHDHGDDTPLWKAFERLTRGCPQLDDLAAGRPYDIDFPGLATPLLNPGRDRPADAKA